MLVQFENNWIQKIALTAKLDSACGLVQFWLSSEFFSSNYFQIGQHIVLLHIRIISFTLSSRTDVCLLKKNFSLRLFLNCSYFSSDFSLNVLIKFVLIKKKECMWKKKTRKKKRT